MGYQSSFTRFPGGLSSESPQQKPVEDGFADFFDYNRYYDQHDLDMEVGSSSGRSSLPDLTSASSPAPSDNGTGPPSSPSIGPLGLKARLNEARQHDDHLTIPKQAQYPVLLPAQPGFGPGPEAYQVTMGRDLYLPPTPPSSASSVSSSPKAHTGRGRRSKPLENKDEVAEVRALGACLHCRISKTRCNDQTCCDKCTKNAVKHNFGDVMDLMCIRWLPSKNRGVFEIIADGQARTITGSSARREMGSRAMPVLWNVFIGDGGTYLPLSVIQRPVQDGAMSVGGGAHYVLNRDAVPSPRDLQAWAASYMLRDGAADFQSGVDGLLHSYAASTGRLHHHDLARKVYELRCMYELFKTQTFWYTSPHLYGQQVQRLPSSIANELRQMAVSTMKSLEMDVLRHLDHALKPLGKSDPWREKLPLWASLMECILLYRDLWMSDILGLAQQWNLSSKGDKIHSCISNLFGTFLAMHDAHFGKDWRGSSPFGCSQAEAHHLSLQFLHILSCRDYFYLELSQSHVMPDVLLYALFVDPRRTDGTQGRRKRVKH